jgi:hypothetical protein
LNFLLWPKYCLAKSHIAKQIVVQVSGSFAIEALQVFALQKSTSKITEIFAEKQ